VLILPSVAAAQAEDAREEVDLELVLLADATGSIDAAEIRLQREGYAAAMVHPEVLHAIAHGGATGRIAVTYVEWAAAASQDVVVDWMVIGTKRARGTSPRGSWSRRAGRGARTPSGRR
jgi:hypothetical protein